MQRTDTTHQFDQVWSLYLPVLLVAGACVALAILLAVLRGRRRGDPSQRHEAPLVELAYVGLLAAVAIVLIAATLHADGPEETVVADPGLTIDLTAFKWSWSFAYPGGLRITGTPGTTPVAVVPAGADIRFSGASNDVIHSFWIPALRFKRDIFPDATTRFDMTFDHAGLYRGRCAEFCGIGHAGMAFIVHAVSPARFQRWLHEHHGSTA